MDVVVETFRRIEALGDPGVFLLIRDQAAVLEDAKALGRKEANASPLWGVPFAIRISTPPDCRRRRVARLRVHAGGDAHVVARLRAAGALLIGKTNLDQFATGLVGTRTPHRFLKTPSIRSCARGSSSGSAVAVAQGLVSFALGTDTAGSDVCRRR